MDATEFDTDSQLKLLSDALRRGPGSPEWQEAVTRFADANGASADEYRLLMLARERLESGKEYRQVRAGPAFTRAVFAELDQNPAHPSAAPRPAVLIGLLCLILLLIGGGVLLMHVIESRPIDAEQAQLETQLFSMPQRQWVFDRQIPPGLKTFGTLKPVVQDYALRAMAPLAKLPAEERVVAPDPIDLAAGACVEAQVRYQPGDTSLAVIVGDALPVPTDAALNNSTLSVIFDAAGVRCVSSSGSTASHAISGGAHTVRIKFLKSVASAEIDGRTIWSGPRPIGPRGYAALQWMKVGNRPNEAGVQSLSVLLP